MLAHKRWIVLAPTVLLLSAGLIGCRTGGKLSCGQKGCGQTSCAPKSCGQMSIPKRCCLSQVFGKSSCLNQTCRPKSPKGCGTTCTTGCATVSKMPMMPGHSVVPHSPANAGSAKSYYTPQAAPMKSAPPIKAQRPMPPADTNPMPMPLETAPPQPKAAIEQPFLPPLAPPEETDTTARTATPFLTVSQSRRISEPNNVTPASRPQFSNRLEQTARPASSPQSYSRAWADALGVQANESYQPENYRR